MLRAAAFLFYTYSSLFEGDTKFDYFSSDTQPAGFNQNFLVGARYRRVDIPKPRENDWYACYRLNILVTYQNLLRRLVIEKGNENR